MNADIFYIYMFPINESIIYFLLVVQCCSHSLLPILHTFVTCLLAPILNTLFGKHTVKSTRFLTGIKVFGGASADQKVVSAGEWHSMYLLCFYFHCSDVKTRCALYFWHM